MRDRTDWNSELRIDVEAKDLSIFDDMYDEKHWNIGDIVDLLTMYQLIQDQELEGDLTKKYKSSYKHYFLILKEEIDSGKLSISKAMDMEKMPSKPKFLPMFSLRYNLRQYTSYIGEKIELLNPDKRLLAQFLLSDDVLRYAKEIGIDFPERSSVLKKNDSQGEEVPEDAIYSSEQPGSLVKKQGQTGTETPPIDNYCSVDSSADVTDPTLIYKEALEKKIRSETGSKKGKGKDKVVEAITARAIEELGPNLECKCQHSELADYLMKLKAEDGSPLFTLPGIKPHRFIAYFLEATIDAFKKKGIPLRNKKKDTPRGRRYCTRHPLD